MEDIISGGKESLKVCTSPQHFVDITIRLSDPVSLNDPNLRSLMLVMLVSLTLKN